MIRKRRYNILVIFCLLSCCCSVKSSWAQDYDGLYSGFHIGTWFPDGHNQALKKPIISGFSAGIKKAGVSYTFVFDLVLSSQSMKPALMARQGDNLVQLNSFGAAQAILESGIEITSGKYGFLEAVGGLGYGHLTLTDKEKERSKGKENNQIAIEGIVLNPGISSTIFLSRKTYLQTKIHYNIANYHSSQLVTGNLRGNYWTLKFIIGHK